MTSHDLVVAEKLGALQATVDNTNRLLNDLRDSISSRLRPIEERVSELEKWRYIMLGGAGVIAYLVKLIPTPSISFGG